jgi:DNA-binding NtrC family response regulator
VQATPQTVLVVDDEPAICKALTIALSREGYAAVSAVNGESAYAILRARHVDVLVLDLRISDHRGDVIYAMATAQQPHLARRTLFITGDISLRAEEIIQACQCPLLRKPFELRELIGLVQGLAEGSAESATA